jgi:hypothetical protein
VFDFKHTRSASANPLAGAFFGGAAFLGAGAVAAARHGLSAITLGRVTHSNGKVVCVCVFDGVIVVAVGLVLSSLS